MNSNNKLTDWDSFYRDNIEKLPWYEKNLDLDVKHEIKISGINTGKFLDVGTGPGTQAVQLASLGFDVTGSDISKNAIKKALLLSKRVNFVVDDILHTSFAENEFDYILDRGCFHIFEPSQRKNYQNQIKKILKDDGILFLKVLSTEEENLPVEQLSYKFSKQNIFEMFGNDFRIKKIKPTVYYGTLDALPKALFAVIQKKAINDI